MPISRLTDNDKMPFGAHEGKQMIDVPAKWLLWAYQAHRYMRMDLQEYIEERMGYLVKEAGWTEAPKRPV